MSITLVSGQLLDMQACAAVLAVYIDKEGTVQLTKLAQDFDAKANGLIQNLIHAGEITAKLNETVVLYPTGFGFGKMVVVGLGKICDFTMDKARQVAGTAIKVAAKGKTEKVITAVHGCAEAQMCPHKAMQAVVEGSVLALFQADLLKKKKAERSLKEIIVVVPEEAMVAKLQADFDKGLIMARSTNLARRLTTLPANYMTPTHMAEEAKEIAAKTGLGLTILDREQMLELGMGCLLGVSQGSVQPPKMIVLRHDGNPESTDVLALVGKGITFDSGGISIKGSQGMEAMKGDMSGAASVLGAMQVIGQLKPKANIIGVVAAAENLPDGNALKPGDVIHGMTGKSIEIISTDAEGRLVLADAVAYAESLGANRIIDVATLTGSSAQAFGGVYATILADDDCFYADTMAAADMAGERFWRMPLADEYRDMYRSPVADIRNGGARGGGMITGGLIINEFIDKAAWIHLDVAGMTSSAEDKPYNPKGYNGFATRTLAELALAAAKE